MKRRKNITILEYTTNEGYSGRCRWCEGIVAETKNGEELIIHAEPTIFASGLVSEDVMSIRQIFRI